MTRGERPRPTASAFVDGLKMLSRRELSEAQVRQRLARRGHEEDAVEEAVRRLTADRSLDDTRVAEAIARTETGVKRRGRLRVRQQIERAGISKASAKQAVDGIFGDLDEDELLRASLAKRLRGAATIPDEATFRRLYRYLVTQGFAHDQVVKALKERRAR